MIDFILSNSLLFIALFYVFLVAAIWAFIHEATRYDEVDE